MLKTTAGGEKRSTSHIHTPTCCRLFGTLAVPDHQWRCHHPRHLSSSHLSVGFVAERGDGASGAAEAVLHTAAVAGHGFLQLRKGMME